MLDWLGELAPILILLAVVTIVILRLPKIEISHGAAFRIVISPDRTDMLFDELLDDRESETRAFRFGSDVRIENLAGRT